MTAACDHCGQPASRFAYQWFQFPKDPHRYVALCEVHWEVLLEELERLAGPAGRCPRCYARLTKPVEKCGVCNLRFLATDPLREAA